MIKYRLKFTFKNDEIGVNRNNNINSLLSDVDTIISDTPIRKPLDGEVILMSGEEYIVLNTIISFENDNDITYYDLIVLLESKRARKEKEDRAKQEKVAKDLAEYMQQLEYKKMTKDDFYKQATIKKYIL